MRKEERASDDFIASSEKDVKAIEAYLRDNKKKVDKLLPWVTEISKEELQFVEDYFISKYQVLPALKRFLKDPVLISFDSTEELFDSKE